jgi:hypothetical protein
LAELTDSGGIPGNQTGISVAISGDTAVLGSLNYLASLGAAYVFVKPSSGWADMHQTATLTPSDGVGGDNFGEVVAIDGDTILVSAQNVSTVYLFVKPPDGWKDMTETAKLTASAPTSRFGLALGINGDTVVIGAYGTQQAGTAYVYVKPQSGWQDMQETAELLAANKGDFGLAVAVYSNTVVVGAPTAFDQSGAIYVYTRPANGWRDVEPIATLTASDDTYGANFGGALSLYRNTLLVGAFLANVTAGEAYVYVRPHGGWVDMKETARLLPPAGSGYFGISVSLSGRVALVGASYLFLQGSAYVFVQPKSGWRTTSHFRAKLQASDGEVDDLFGSSVSNDGAVQLVGAFQQNVSRGAAYVFGP